MNDPKHIIIHHSVSPDTYLKNFDAIKKWHIEHNGWKDIGYHYVLEDTYYGAKIYRGRSLIEEGAHAHGFNDRSIGICLVGNYDKDYPSYKRIVTLLNLCSSLILSFNIPIENVLGHRETYTFLGKEVKKSCPGKNIDMYQIRDALKIMS